MIRSLRPLAVVCLVLLVAGCGAPARTVSGDDLAARLPDLERRAADAPDDAGAQAALGLALFALDRGAEARPALEAACRLDPERFETAMALADLDRADGRDAEAAAVLADVRAKGKEQERQLQATRERVEYAALEARMKQLAERERTLDVAAAPEGTLGVLDFAPPPANRDLESLGKAMTAVLTTELSGIDGLRLVERRELHVLQEELAMSAAPRSVGEAYPDLAPADGTLGIQQRLALLSPAPGEPPFYAGPLDGVGGPRTQSAVRDFQRAAGLTADGVAGPKTIAAIAAALERHVEDSVVVSPDTAPRAGRLLGARTLLGGSFAVAGTDRLEARAELVDVAGAGTISSFGVDAPVTEFYRLPGEVTVKALEAMGFSVGDSERRRLLNRPPPTRDLAAFLAFGRAVDLEDKGRFDEAASAYRDALALDPGFRLAQDRVEVLSVDTAAFRQSVDRAARAAGNAAAATGASTRGAVNEAIGAVGTGVAEDAVRDDSAGAERAPQADGSPTGSVRVTGHIPVPPQGGKP